MFIHFNGFLTAKVKEMVIIHVVSEGFVAVW